MGMSHCPRQQAVNGSSAENWPEKLENVRKLRELQEYTHGFILSFPVRTKRCKMHGAKIEKKDVKNGNAKSTGSRYNRSKQKQERTKWE